MHIPTIRHLQQDGAGLESRTRLQIARNAWNEATGDLLWEIDRVLAGGAVDQPALSALRLVVDEKRIGCEAELDSLRSRENPR